MTSPFPACIFPCGRSGLESDRVARQPWKEKLGVDRVREMSYIKKLPSNKERGGGGSLKTRWRETKIVRTFQSTTESKKKYNGNNSQNQVESLILAQNERWRRA